MPRKENGNPDAEWPEWLTVPEGARYLRVNPRTIYGWLAEKKLTAHKLSTRSLRLRREDLDALLTPDTRD